MIVRYCVKQAPTIRCGAPTSGPLEGPSRFHNHVVYNGVAYIAGQTAKDHSVQDYAAQTEQVQWSYLYRPLLCCPTCINELS